MRFSGPERTNLDKFGGNLTFHLVKPAGHLVCTLAQIISSWSPEDTMRFGETI